MMSGEALMAALQGARDPSDTAYRELVETLITEVEVEEVQERAWQRQRRSQLRIAELEAREDARGGGTQPSAALGAQSGEGTKANEWRQSAEDESGVRSEPNASPGGQSGNRSLSDDWKQFSEHGVKDSPIRDENPPSRAVLRAIPGSPRQTGDKIRELEAELAVSIERERDSVRRLQGYGPLTLGDLRRPSSKTRDRAAKLGRLRPEQPQGEVTETEDSAWQTDSGSGSQESTPTSEGSAESSRLWTPESAAERPSERHRAAVNLEAPKVNRNQRESSPAISATVMETGFSYAAKQEAGSEECSMERVGASLTIAEAATVLENRNPLAMEEETGWQNGAFEQIDAPTAETRVLEPRASSGWEEAAPTAAVRGLSLTGLETVPHVELGRGGTSTAVAEGSKPQNLSGLNDAATTAVAESLNPETPSNWEEVAQVKTEQLEEAKLLLAAVMEGERAALETVARLEQELRDSREAKEGLEQEVRDIEEAAERLIQELRSRTEAEKRLKQELEDMREAQLGMERRSAVAAALAGKQMGELSARVEEGVGGVQEEGRAEVGSKHSEEEEPRLAIGDWKGSEGVRPIVNGVRMEDRNAGRLHGENGDISQRNSGAHRKFGTSSASSSETESADAQTLSSAGRRGGWEAEFWERKELTPSVEQQIGEPGRQEGGTGPFCNLQKRHKESVEVDDLDGASASHSDSEAGGQSEKSRFSGNRSDKGSRGEGEEGSTREELTVREAAYRSQCEALQQQVRSALDQVELLRKQQTEREERAAALYEGRLSAYVKQMVGVRRENEALRLQQQELQAEKAHVQEQLEAEHQKRRDEFQAAHAQLDSFSERVLQQACELRTARLAFLDVTRLVEGDSAERLKNGGESDAKLEMLNPEVQEIVNCGKDKSAKGVLDSCQRAMARFENEVKEQLGAMEKAAGIGEQLEERVADLVRVRGERDAAENLAERLEKDLEKTRAEKQGAEDVARRLEADMEKMRVENEGMQDVARLLEEDLQKMRVEKQGAWDLVRRLEADLETARVEKEGVNGREGALRAQVADLERRRGEQLKKVAYLEEQLRQRESSLEQYKAEIQEELAGLSEHMHLAAAERAREDAEFRERMEERDWELRTREETIRTLEKRIRTLEETGSSFSRKTDTLEETKSALEREVRDLRQQLWKEKELSESVQRRLQAFENAQHERKAPETDGSCPKCGEREAEWREKSRLEREAFVSSKEDLQEQSRGLAAEVKSMQGLLMRKETRVGELEGKVHELLGEREELERALKESEAKQRAMGRQLAEKEEEVNGLKEKVVRIDAGWGLDDPEGSEAPWDELRKEQLIAEVQGILEQYSVAGEGSGQSRRGRGADDASENVFEEVEGSEGPSEEVEGSRKESESAMEEPSERAEAFQGGVSAARGDVYERVEVSEIDLAFNEQRGWVRVNRGGQRGAAGKAELRPFTARGLEHQSGELFAQAWAERERRLRTEVQGALSEFERQEETVRRAYEAEISALKEKVRLLEEGQGPSETAAGREVRMEGRELGRGATSRTGLGKQIPGLAGERVLSDGQGNRSAATSEEAKGVSAEAVLDVRVREAEAGLVAQAAGLAGQTAGLVEQTAGLVGRSAGSAGRSELSPKDRRSLDSGQSGAWSDKRPNGEERLREGASGDKQAGRLAEEREEKAVLNNVWGELARVLEENRRVVDENASLRSKVAELAAVNRELQLRVKVLEDDRSRLLEKEAQAVELAALQAKLDEASAKATEQKSRYKHLKGKYLRQLARQQAMHEYMEGESPANLSPRSGVAPSVGRPGNNLNHSGPPSCILGPPSYNNRPRSEAGGQMGRWTDTWGDSGPEQRQGLVAQNGDASQGQSDGPREQMPPSGRSSVSECLHGVRRSDMERSERAEDHRCDQRQIDGSEIAWGRGAPGSGGQWKNRASLDEIPEKGPSSAHGQSEGQTQFQTQVGSRTGSSRDRTPNTSRSVSVEHGRNGSALTTPYGSRLPSRRQSGADSVQAHSRIPVGLRVLMDGRPLPGFPAKVEDLGGYFAEARAQKDGALSVKLPSSRASSPFLRRKVERRVSRASSAPPMRPSYNRLARVWV